MIRTINKHQRWLMIVIAILSLPFLLYFVKDAAIYFINYLFGFESGVRSDQFARIYDRNISMIQARRYARLCDLARQLGMSTFVQDLAAAAQNRDDMYTQF